MTPREADIAFILEGMAEVRGVYVLPPSPWDPPSADMRDVIVAMDGDSRSIAVLHYALLRAFSRKELGGVSFFIEVPGVLLRRAVRLELSAAERRAARERVEERRRALRPELPATVDDPWAAKALYLRQPTTASPLRLLFVSGDQALQHALISGLPSGWRTPFVRDPEQAAYKALCEPYDLALCEASSAFGEKGFFEIVDHYDASGARTIVFLATAHEEVTLRRALVERGLPNIVLVKPFDPRRLEDLVDRRPWRIPLLLPRTRKTEVHDRHLDQPKRWRVLVVDDDPSVAALLAEVSSGRWNLEVVATTDEWEAVDAASIADLVVCSATKKAPGGAPFYRFLWSALASARADLKERFCFVADAGDPNGPSARVMARPLRAEMLVERCVALAGRRSA